MHSSSNSKRLFRIDASLLKESDCEYKSHLIHTEGLVSTAESFKQQYGTAGHKALAKFYRKESIEECLKIALNHYLQYCHQAPEGDFRTIEHLAETLKGYFKQYSADPFKPLVSPIDNLTPLIEIPFAYPFYKDNNTEVLIEGTIDAIGILYGQKCIMDHKFTSVRAKDSYLQGYELDTQVCFYIWALKKMNLTDTYLPFVINAVFLLGPTKKEPASAIYQRSNFIYYTEEQLIQFDKWVSKKVAEIIKECEKLPNYNRCITKYGKCQFFNLCRLKEEHRNDYKSLHFSTRIYDPLTFQN